MTLDELIDSITPEIYERLKRAVEIGKWDNGVGLTADQRQQSLQALIAYDAKRSPKSDRVGYIEPKNHSACDQSDDDQWQPLNIQD